MITFCPGCAREISEKDEVCPFCSRDFRGPSGPAVPIPGGEGSAGAPSAPGSKPRRPVILEPVPPVPIVARILPWAVAAAVAGLVLFSRPKRYVGPPVPARAAPTIPAAPAPRPGPAPEPRPEPPPPPPVEDISPQPATEATELSPAPRRRGRARPEKPVFVESYAEDGEGGGPTRGKPGSSKAWRIHGTVFDLITLKPVVEADVVFTDPANGTRFPTATDSEGRYKAELPVNDQGYALMITHPLYEPKYAQDEDGTMRHLSPEDRNAMALQFGQTLQHKEMLKGSAGERIRRDFALIPSAR